MRFLLHLLTVTLISSALWPVEAQSAAPLNSSASTEDTITNPSTDPSEKDPPRISHSRSKKKTSKGSGKHTRSKADSGEPGMTANAKASVQTPGKVASVESKTIYDYMPDAIYRLYASPLHIVDIQLQPGEELTGKVVAGDTARWTVGVVPHGEGSSVVQHVLVKPHEAGLETNFLILTNRHSYHMWAKSDAHFYIPTIGWNYPQEEWTALEMRKAENQRLQNETQPVSLAPEALNFKYRIKPKGDYRWTPLRAFDDGQKTYIQMNPQMKNYDAPVLFVKGKEGINLVNYRVKGDYFIIDRLFDEAELRSGKNDVVSIEREKKKGFWSFLPWVD